MGWLDHPGDSIGTGLDIVTKLLGLFQVIVVLTFLGLTLYCDLSLYLSIKSRNVSNQARLTPWKSNLRPISTTIPIRATAIGLVSLVIIVICYIIFFYYYYSDFNGFLLNVGTTWSVILLPMILIFTVKQKRRVNLQPPKCLHFYNDENIEMNNIQAKVEQDDHFQELSNIFNCKVAVHVTTKHFTVTELVDVY